LNHPIIRKGLTLEEMIEMPKDVVVNGREIVEIRRVTKGFILLLMGRCVGRHCYATWQLGGTISADCCWMVAYKFAVHFIAFSTNDL